MTWNPLPAFKAHPDVVIDDDWDAATEQGKLEAHAPARSCGGQAEQAGVHVRSHFSVVQRFCIAGGSHLEACVYATFEVYYRCDRLACMWARILAIQRLTVAGGGHLKACMYAETV